jgi:hypothetical protein
VVTAFSGAIIFKRTHFVCTIIFLSVLTKMPSCDRIHFVMQMWRNWQHHRRNAPGGRRSEGMMAQRSKFFSAQAEKEFWEPQESRARYR